MYVLHLKSSTYLPRQVCTSEAQYNHMSAPIFFFDHPDNKTDVFMGGDIDSSLVELTKKMGWWDELREMSGREEGDSGVGDNAKQCRL